MTSIAFSWCYKQFQLGDNSFQTAKPNFVPFGTIFPAAVVFEQRPNLKFWHAEKIDLEKSFSTSTNFICFAFANLEIFGFKVGVFFCKKSQIY